MKTTTPQTLRPVLRWLNRMAVVCAVLLINWLGCFPSRANDYQVNCDPAYYSLREGTPPTSAAADAYSGAGATAFLSPQGGRNLVFIFPLPVLASNETITAAQLHFTISALYGSPSFNADLWGIGFQTNTTPLLEYLEADTEDLGNTRLQDNLVTPGMAAGNQATTTNAAGMAAYLQGFYTSHPGYAGGAYVFLRVNPDVNAGIADVGWAIALAGSASPPLLQITTSESVLTVFPQPVDLSVSLGANLTNSCQAVGGVPPYTYQWWHQAALVVGETNAQLILSNVQTFDAGSYFVIVQDAAGHSATSRVAVLDVDPTFTKITDSPVVNYASHSGGVAWGDYNNDGFPDLIIPHIDASLHLFHNNGDGTFRQLTAADVGEIVNVPVTWFANWGDYNNDGYLDLSVASSSSSGCVLFRNNGNGTFTRMWDRSDVFGGLWGDFDKDGWLDLFPIGVWGSLGRYNCLLKNNQGDATFTQRTDNPMSLNTADTEGADAMDIDDDGDLEIMTAGYKYQGVANIYRNDGNLEFTQISNALTTPGLNPFGFAWGDYDNDGLMDVYISRPGSSGTLRSLLFHNDGGGQFSTNTSVEFPTGLANGVWGDFDNDGDLDLYIWGGAYSAFRSVFYSNNGDGTFTRILRGSLVNDLPQSSACAWADYDNNGFLDLVVGGETGVNSLFRNNGNTNKWLLLKLVGTASNRAAIGAKVRTRATIFGKSVWQMREIHGGNRMQNDLRAHFGLGNATNVDIVRIEWPSGIVQELTNVVAGQFLTVTEPVVGITVQPADQVAYVGGSVTNFAEANGAKPPIDYQWYFNGGLLSGAIWPTLIVSNIQPSQAGAYYCVARDDEGNYVTSRVATVTVELLKCQGVCLETGTFQFNLSGNVGDHFELLRSAVVTPPPPATNWVVIQTITLTNRTAVISDFIATDNKNFYLIRRVP